jgi:nucleotidyltransferase DUF2204
MSAHPAVSEFDGEGQGRGRDGLHVERRALARSPLCDAASPSARQFYTRVMKALDAASVEYLVGGTYAFTPYTGIARSTKDFDIFVRPDDISTALGVLENADMRVDMTFPHWLAKVFHRRNFVDIIFNSGNGVTPVDEQWFTNSSNATVLGVEVRLAPPEEMLWSKAFVMERERYDGADIMHILRSRAERLDWDRLLVRFGERWRVLLFNLILFGFVYPAERARIPARVMRLLTARLDAELDSDSSIGRVCQGTLVSREQYLPDTQDWGYADGRQIPFGNMTSEQLIAWTASIGR